MVARRAVSTPEEITKPEIIYPDTDGMPFPDGYYQEEHVLDIIPTLKLFFEGDPRVAVSGNTL